MKRITILAVAFVVVAVTAVVLGRGSSIFRPTDTAPAVDSDWYNASDVAEVGQTGHLQLVEFFHPG